MAESGVVRWGGTREFQVPRMGCTSQKQGWQRKHEDPGLPSLCSCSQFFPVLGTGRKMRRLRKDGGERAGESRCVFIWLGSP